MLPYLREHFGNPSSGHAFGRRSQQAIAKARNQVASLLGCADDEVVFTSGGTEANNLAIRGVMEAAGQSGRVVTSVVEHPATEQPCAWLERRGTQVVRLGLPCGACDGVRGRHRDGGARRRGDGLRAADPRPAHVGGRRRASRRGVDSFVEKRERAPVTITIGARSCHGVGRSVVLFPRVPGSVERDFAPLAANGEPDGSGVVLRFVHLHRNLRRRAEFRGVVDDLAAQVHATTPHQPHP